MNVFVLSGFLSPSECPPTFVIPTFTCFGSNELFAQDLNEDGSIKGFCPINPRLFYPVPIYPSMATLSEGQEGVLAFWSDQSTVEVALSGRMKNTLGRTTTSDAYVNLDIAGLIEDDELARSAIDEIAEDFNDNMLAASWRQQELNALSSRQRQRLLTNPETPNVNAELRDRDFKSLTSDPDAEWWIDRWLKLWNVRYNAAGLEDIAFWWFDLGPGRHSSANPIFLSLARGGNDERVGRYAIQWLDLNSIEVQNWTTIWSAIQRRRYRNSDELGELAYRKLDKSIGSLTYISYAWCYLWYMLWNTRFRRQACVELATNAWLATPVPHRWFSDFVLHFALSQESAPLELFDAAKKWLSNDLRSVVLWANLFIKTYNRIGTSPLEAIGERWTAEYGGNINRWYDVWKLLSPKLGPDRSIGLGISWLRRSRWDLSSWSKTYNDIATNPNIKEYAREVVAIGNSWLQYQKNFPANARKIKQSLSYLESMYLAG